LWRIRIKVFDDIPKKNKIQGRENYIAPSKELKISSMFGRE